MPQGAPRPGEFELIERYFRPLATGAGSFDLLDDATIVTVDPGEDLVVTADLVAEGVHFFADDPPGAIAQKALRVNLSDLAGKGASAVGYLLTIALRSDWTEAWIAAFTDGLRADQDRFGIPLLGGDTSRAANGTTITITAIGAVAKGTMVRRAGAQPGDAIFVSGTIGDAALGLAIRLTEVDPAPAGEGAAHLLARYLLPEPRMGLAETVRRFANSAMDVSDGLVGDLGHICETSRVTATIEADAVPLSAPARALVRAKPLTLITALTGGDDYEVLTTVSEQNAAAFAAAAAQAGVPVHRIGTIVAGAGPPVVMDSGGKSIVLNKVSHTHF